MEIHIPQLGEGLREVRILTLYKKPGDAVKADEVLYQMETDKATLDVESPVDGTLAEWLVVEGDVSEVGFPIARFEGENEAATAVDVETPHGKNGATLNGANGLPRIPPRTIAYARSIGMPEETLRLVPAASKTLSVEDLKLYVERQTPSDGSYTDLPLSANQATLNYHLVRSQSLIVPAVMKMPVAWDRIEAVRTKWLSEGRASLPSEFQIFAYCVAQATTTHPKFRSALLGNGLRREYAHLNLAFAVALPDDDLAVAVIRCADELDVFQFASEARKALRRTRKAGGADASEAQMVLSYLGPESPVMEGVPVLVSPAVATLFVGATQTADGHKTAQLTMTFDHRLMNGYGAASFLRDLRDRVEHVAD